MEGGSKRGEIERESSAERAVGVRDEEGKGGEESTFGKMLNSFRILISVPPVLGSSEAL